MSLTTPWRGRGQHRGKPPAQLRRELDKATCDLVALATRLYEVTAERNQLERQLDTAGIDLSGALEDLRAAEVELRELRAFKANATAVSAPASTRDIDPGDQPTVPVPLWQAPIAGPVITTPANPAA